MVKRMLAVVVVCVLLAGYRPVANGQISVTLEVCGVVTVYVPASQLLPGLITIGAVPHVIAAGTTLAGHEDIQIGADMCLSATLNVSLQITSGSIFANVRTSIEVCGVVNAYVAATQNAVGSLTIGGVTYVIAAGTTIDGQETIAIGLEMCFTATLDAFLQIIPPSTIVVNVTTTIDVCGTVNAYVAATSTSTGFITIDGVRYDIAIGVVVENEALIVVGASICLHATVNVNGEIIVIIIDPPNPNHAPTIAAPSSASVAVGGTLNFSVTASDVDSGDTVTLTGSSLPTGATLTPNPATGNPATSQFHFTPTAQQSGQTFTVAFAASDSHGGNANASCQISVTPGGGGDTNHAPTISVPGPQTTGVGQTVMFTVTASDPDADVVTLSASNVPPGGSFDPGSGGFTFTPSANQAGQTFTIVFTATDPDGASVSDSVLVTVTSQGTNHPPTLSVPGPQSIGVGQTIVFGVTATDPDGDAVTLSASQVPSGATFNPATGVLTFTPAAIQAGQVFTIIFTAMDTNGANATASVAITVTEGGGGGNLPPVISVPPSPISIEVGDTLEFTVTATAQVSNCDVTLAASSIPLNATFDPATGAFVFVPAESQANRSFTVTFTALDCNGLTATATVTIVVVPDGGGGGGGGDDDGATCVAVSLLGFTTVPVGDSCGFVMVPVANSGAGVLRVESATFTVGTEFRVEGFAPPANVQPGGYILLKVVFAPTSAGLKRDTLQIVTSDPAHPTLTIKLKGKAR